MNSIKIIYGTEEYLMEEARRKFILSCRKMFGSDIDVQTFSKETPPARVVESFEGTSLFGSGGICIWNESPYLPVKHGGRSRSKLSKDEEWFLDKISRLPDQQAVLFYTKGIVDTGGIFYRKLKPLADIVQCEPVTDRNAMMYVTEYLKEKQKTLTGKAEQYLHALFQTWESISLMYVFSELEKLCIMLDEGQTSIDVAELTHLFAGTMEKNLFTFMDAFLHRDGRHAIPLLPGLFSRQDVFLKNTGYMMSRLRLLKAYKELKHSQAGAVQCESVLAQINKGRSVKYVLFSLKKVETYWTAAELDELISNIFKLQLNIRRGMGSHEDMVPLVCLYCCSAKGRHL